MPTPATTDLPRPTSWDEFEDICADLLMRLWGDPYLTRNGRSGQAQNGVDIYGEPQHLGGPGSGKYAVAQCKRVDTLKIGTVETEVEAARGFEPTPSEFVMMTTAPRDATLQKEVRTKTWPFPVNVIFWEDLSLRLSGFDDLLQKHFPGWMKRTTTKEQVINMVRSSQPSDFDYDDGTGVYVSTRDVKLRIILNREAESEREFDEPWVRNYPDPRATRQPVYIHYGETRIMELLFVYADGARHIIPCPKSAADLTIDKFQYHIGTIINAPFEGYGFDFGLSRAGISVRTDG